MEVTKLKRKKTICDKGRTFPQNILHRKGKDKQQIFITA